MHAGVQGGPFIWDRGILKHLFLPAWRETHTHTHGQGLLSTHPCILTDLSLDPSAPAKKQLAQPASTASTTHFHNHLPPINLVPAYINAYKKENKLSK